MIFKTIIADPAWPYKNLRTGGSMSSGSASKYSTMSMEDLKSLPVNQIADPKGAVLFLWVTVPLLPESIEVMKGWGFKYTTSIFWHKIGRLGMGFWYAGQIEMCLIGTMGKVKPFRCRKRNVIESKPRAHSQKPDGIWDMIEPYAQDPKIELFCRGEPRPGWYGWGLECKGERCIDLVWETKTMNTKSKTCTICGGHGKVRSPIILGYSKSNIWRTCKRCNGSGQEPIVGIDDKN